MFSVLIFLSMAIFGGMVFKIVVIPKRTFMTSEGASLPMEVE